MKELPPDEEPIEEHEESEIDRSPVTAKPEEELQPTYLEPVPF